MALSRIYWKHILVLLTLNLHDTTKWRQEIEVIALALKFQTEKDDKCLQLLYHNTSPNDLIDYKH